MKKTRFDIFNVIKVEKPTQEELDALKPPNVNKIINRTQATRLLTL